MPSLYPPLARLILPTGLTQTCYKDHSMFTNTLRRLAGAQKHFINFVRIAIFIVMAWIGGLKAFPYEAVGIVPFVANSPFMGFLLKNPPPEYQQYKNREGERVEKNIAWHKQNRTYIFSYGLGIMIVGIGLFVLSGIWSPVGGMIGGAWTIIMSVVTLSFLITTPETWVPALGDVHHGFPYLSGAGRLVLKDIIMMSGGFVILSDSAARYLARRQPA